MPWTPGTVNKTKSRNVATVLRNPAQEHVMDFDPLALGPSALDRIIGQSAPMRELKRNIERAALCQCILLIRGETGTGKMLVARALHELGPRKSKPFIHVNCGAISESLIESELFGHVKGSFTGAHANRKGHFEAAHGGVIFLDEIAEMHPLMQVKLLHTLQEQRYLPVGASQERETDVRIITATHRNLEAAVGEGRLRADFFHRINEVTLTIPSLRERRDDIPLLVQFFLSRVWSKVGLAGPARITHEAMARLANYLWPGNVRQLEKMIISLSFNADREAIATHHVEAEFRKAASSLPSPESESVDGSLRDFIQTQERQRLAFIERAIDREDGNVTAAAERLKVQRAALYKMRERLAKRIG
jgi:transcriptional regulator with PAS, ATPase and Fis domain